MAQSIAEAFLESNWDDADKARTARDTRAVELQAAGYECDCMDLWNVAGDRVYVLTAEPVEVKRVISAGSATAQGQVDSTGSTAQRRGDNRTANSKPTARRRRDGQQPAPEIR